MIVYFVIVSICWIALYAVYEVFLKKETFFHTNRAYLLFSLILGLLIPIYRWIPASWYVQTQDSTTYVISTAIHSNLSVVPEYSWSGLHILMLVYLVGVFILLSRFMLGILRIYRLYKHGLHEQHAALNIVYTNQVHLPFSFWQTVFISKKLPMKAELERVLKHEAVHIKAWHTLDVLMVQLLHVFFWFNPVIRLYKKAIRQAHEYVADAVVIKDISRKSYGQLLLRQSQAGMEIALANHFFQSQIKKRIIMMYQEKSERPALVKYLMAAPVLAILLLVFSSHTALLQTNSTALDCDNPSLATYNYAPKGSITFKYCKDEQDKITFAEIVESKTTIQDRAMRARLLEEFIHGTPPPTPPPPLVPATLINVEQLTTGTSTQEVFEIVEKMPIFPGCENKVSDSKAKRQCSQQKFIEYIYSNLKYPEQAIKRGTQGVVVLQFVVKQDGTIGDTKVVRSLSDVCDEAAVKVVNSINEAGIKWKPGVQRGKVVNVLYTLPIRFKLNDNTFKTSSCNPDKKSK